MTRSPNAGWSPRIPESTMAMLEPDPSRGDPSAAVNVAAATSARVACWDVSWKNVIGRSASR